MQPHTEFQWERDPCRFLGQQRFGERVKRGEDSAPWCWEVEVCCWAFSEQLYNLPEELDPPLCEGSALLHCHPGQVTIWVTFFYLCLQFQLYARCSLSCFSLSCPTGAGSAAGWAALLREVFPGHDLDQFGESNTHNS